MQAQMFDRLLVLQCFLHSDDSSRLTLRLRRDAQGRPKLDVKGAPVRGAYWSSIKAGLKLAANGLKLRGLPVVPAMQFAEPGRSYHSGGTFPMRRSPGRLETDVLGQFPGAAWRSLYRCVGLSQHPGDDDHADGHGQCAPHRAGG